MTTSTTKKEQVPKMTLSCDAGCGNHSNKLLQCSGCHAVRYCDQTCQHNHWPQHKEACRKIAGRRCRWPKNDDIEARETDSGTKT